MMNIEELIGRFAHGPNVMALGPSAIEAIASNEIVLDESVTVAVPDNFMRLLELIRDGSAEHQYFLIRIMRYFRNRAGRYRFEDADRDRILADRVIAVVADLANRGRLEVVEGDDDPGVRDSLSELYRGRTFEISLSPRRNFLRDYLVRIYSWSKRTGGLVIERTRKVFSDLGRHIATLQLPDRLDDCVHMKSRYIARAFDYRGGAAAKFFVSCAIGVAGLTYYPAGLVGVVIAFADP